MTLMDNSEVEESPPSMKSEVKENLSFGKENEPEIVGKTRSARRRFPKPRMTVFQMYDGDDQPVVIQSNSSRKGNMKYFDALESGKICKSDEGLNTSHVSLGISDTQSVKKSKAVTQLFDNYDEIQNSKLLSSKKQTRISTRSYTKRQSVNLDNGVINSPNPRRARKTSTDKGSNENETFEPQTAEKANKKLATTGRKRQGRYFKKFSVNMMEDDNITEDVLTEKNAEDRDPQLTETFEIEEHHSSDVHMSRSKNKLFPAKLRRSVRRKTMISSPKGSNNIYTPKDAKEESPKLNDTFEIEECDVSVEECKREEKNEISSSEIRRSVRKQAIPKEHAKISPLTQDAKEESHKLNGTFEIEECDVSMEECMREEKNEISSSEIRRSVRKQAARKEHAKISPLTEDAKEESPKLNETFEIEECDVSMEECMREEKNEISSREIRRSVRKQATPKEHAKISPFTEDAKEESPKLNETFEIEECDVSMKECKREGKNEISSEIRRSVRKQATPKEHTKMSPLTEDSKELDTQRNEPINNCNVSFSKLKNEENVERRRSRSCPQETDNKKEFNFNFFSPSSKSVVIPKGSTKKGTPMKSTRIPKFIKKMPDFQNIHKKQFEKMESVVDSHQRKIERAQGLLSPVAMKNPVMVFTAQAAIKQTPLKKPATQHRGLTKVNSRYVSQSVLRDNNAPSPAQNARNIYNKQNVKELITKKLPIHDRRENVRQDSRTTIRGVRLNRRFELQMAHRKIN